MSTKNASVDWFKDPSNANSSMVSNIDLYAQVFTLINGTGHEINVTMADVDYLRMYGTRLALNWGTQIGASIVLLLVLILLTRPEKRRSSIFIMNVLCLIINIVRSVTQACWLTGNYWNFYSQLVQDSSRDTLGDKVNTILSNTTTLMLVICIMASLSMQVWVVCKATAPLRRAIIFGTSSTLGLVAIGFRFAVTVISNEYALTGESMHQHNNLIEQMHILQGAAITVYCAIFTAKLGCALVRRRKLGMTQFGPMQIVFVMGAQTMFIPAIFSICQLWNWIPEIGTQTLTVVCIFLPLSSIWAGVAANDRHMAANAHQFILLQDHFGRTPAGSPSATLVTGQTTTKCGTITSNTLTSNNHKDFCSPTCIPSTPEEGFIRVNNEWKIEEGEPSRTRAHSNI